MNDFKTRKITNDDEQNGEYDLDGWLDEGGSRSTWRTLAELSDGHPLDNAPIEVLEQFKKVFGQDDERLSEDNVWFGAVRIESWFINDDEKLKGQFGHSSGKYKFTTGAFVEWGDAIRIIALTLNSRRGRFDVVADKHLYVPKSMVTLFKPEGDPSDEDLNPGHDMSWDKKLDNM